MKELIEMGPETESIRPVGIFDSGVGGLSVLRAIRNQLPSEDILYFGDQAHIPYGQRTKEDVRELAFGITRFLLNLGAKMIVVACNTASAAALQELRRSFPDVPFVGMEPAVKPAAENTHSGKVGVLATPTTFAGEMYASVVERFAKDVQILTSTCPGLVERVEAGDLEGPLTREILENALLPMLEAGIDTIVMGCTHYPFVIPLVQSITGIDVNVIDPAPAIARQARRLLEGSLLINAGEEPGDLQFYTSGDPGEFSDRLATLLGERGPIRQVYWEGGQVRVA